MRGRFELEGRKEEEETSHLGPSPIPREPRWNLCIKYFSCIDRLLYITLLSCPNSVLKGGRKVEWLRSSGLDIANNCAGYSDDLNKRLVAGLSMLSIVFLSHLRQE
jgi:hypothetical protein